MCKVANLAKKTVCNLKNVLGQNMLDLLEKQREVLSSSFSHSFFLNIPKDDSLQCHLEK